MGCAGSGFSAGASSASKACGPAAGQLLERALVQIGQQHGDGPVQLGQAEEAPVAQPRQDPALDHLHADLHLGLVARVRPGAPAAPPRRSARPAPASAGGVGS
jgi:hypothetical protein